MKKNVVILLAMLFGMSAMAQQSIHLRSADKAECVTSDMTSLKASFSFSTIEAQDYESQRGLFSWLSLPNTVIGGNEGDPQIPVVNELIAVPFGANPRIEITSYSTQDYRLDDYGIHTLVPRQPSLRKDQKPEDVPFVMNEAAYQTRGFRSEPMAVVNVVGTMRGVQLGKMTIEPVSYDPVSNTLRVFNDIEVEVHFDGADAKATEDMLVKTYSPYFDGIYNMLFNGRSIRSAYDDHPDLYTTPVKMLVVTTSTYTNSTPFQTWLTWKKQKGIDVDVQTVTSSTSSANVRSLIQSRYNANHPTFLVIVGDETAVKNYTTYSVTGLNYNPYVSDLQYASIDDDVYHDMFMSRMSVSNTTELGYLVDKILMYEKYTMPDPSYLNNVLLIAGADGTWAPRVGRPTINYAADNYYNAAHGFNNVYKYVTDNYTGCYNYLSSGVGFANYTAHGDIQEWYNPNFTNDNVNALTNANKYFWAMGNCCLTANWGNSDYYPCYGEAMIRAQNKGAFGYIGSIPESYWWEDYYFGVGATSTYNQTPAMSQTTTGVYDFMFDDTQMNTLNSVPFAGNVAVTYAHAGSYSYSVSDEYYWRAYQCLGDGSVMPYHTQPVANHVNHASTIGIGMATFTVSADAGSYVSITKNNEILGVAQVPSNGTVDVPVSGLNSAGDVMIVVTRQQRQPYIQTIQAVSLDGPYISVDSYSPNTALVGENTNLSITFKNVGTAATTGTTTVTLTTTDSNVTILTGTKTFGALAANATTTVNDFGFCFNPGIALGSNVAFHYSAVNGSNTWEGNITITPNQVFTVTVAANNTYYGTVSGGGEFNYGESCTVTATPAEGYMFTNWTLNDEVVSTVATYTFNVTGDTDLVAHFAEGVMIGDGGIMTEDYLPTYNYYNYSLTEQIYTSAELGGAGLITSIAFYNGGETKSRTLVLYMKSTTKNNFSGNKDWIAVSSSDKVFSGNVTFTANEWTVIAFSTPFVYDGTSNVVLVTDDNSGDYTDDPHMSCRVFDATNQAIYVYDDDTNYNPTSPSSYNGTVMSQKNQIILTKAAIPTEPVYITVSVSPAQAGTATGGGEYPFGGICTVSVTSNVGYFFTGWTENGVVVSSDLEYSFTATSDRELVATFVQGIEIGESTTTNSYLPSYNYYNYSLTQQIYTADEIGAAGTINWIAFYNEGAEKTRTYDFYLKATEKTSFSSKSDWITVAASDKVFTGSVTMASGTWTIINFTTPFEYDGTSNLVLVADDNTGDFTESPHMTCSVFNTDENQAIYIYNDDTNFNPMSPPAASTKNGVLSKKNHILLGIETIQTFTKEIAGYTEGCDDHYYLIASPIGEVNPADVENMLSNSYDFYYFDQAASDGLEWINIKDGNTNLVSGKGYLYANSENVTIGFTGMPYNGNGEVTLTKTANTQFEGWNLVGNPFAQTAYITKAFYTMNDDGSAIIAGTGNSVEAMQGIFVIAETNGETMTFNTEATAKNTPALVMNVTRNRGAVIDRVIVNFSEDNSLPKFMLNQNSTKLYIPQSDKDYAVVSALSGMGELPVSFKAENNGTYTLNFSSNGVEFNYLHLIDNITGANIDLLATPSYTFEAHTTDYASRFKLVFATGVSADSENFAFISNGNLIVNGTGLVQVIDITGRVVAQGDARHCVSTSGMTKGVYVLRLINGNDMKTQKIIID